MLMVSHLSYIAVSVTITFWLEAYYTEAYICTAIMCIGSIVQYHYCLRIYNRFNFDEDFKDIWEKTENEREIRDSSAENEHNDTMNMFGSGLMDPASSDMDTDTALRESFGVAPTASSAPVKRSLNKNKSIFQSMFFQSLKHESSASNLGTSVGAGSMLESEVGSNSQRGAGFTASNNMHKEVYKQGYLSIKDKKKWSRYYVVVNCTHIWYYKDKHRYDHSPEQPVKLRPIRLDHYTPSVGLTSPPFNIILKAKDARSNLKDWEFKTDTADEQTEWMRVLRLSSYHGDTARQKEIMINSSESP